MYQNTQVKCRPVTTHGTDKPQSLRIVNVKTQDCLLYPSEVSDCSLAECMKNAVVCVIVRQIKLQIACWLDNRRIWTS